MILPPEDDYLRMPPLPRRGRQYSRGGNSGGGGGGGGGGMSGGVGGISGSGNMAGPSHGGPAPRKYRGQYVRTRSPPQGKYDSPHQGQQPYNNSHLQQQPQSYNTNPNRQQSSSRGPQQHRSPQTDIEDIKEICSKLSVELELVKTRVNEIAGNLERMQSQMSQHPPGLSAQNLNQAAATDNSGRQKKAKVLRKHHQDRVAAPGTVGSGTIESAINNAVARNNKERNLDRQRRNRRRDDDRDRENKVLAPRLQNDDSTTQAVDPSSEDKVEGEEECGERVKKVFRRKRQPFKKGYNRRRRVDSSERNSNDTSPQNETVTDDYRKPKPRNGQRKSFPELSEAELNEVVQALRRDFFASEVTSVRKVIEEKGPLVAKEFAMSILDHAICDVTSPTKLSDIANNLAQVLVSEEVGFEFQQGFYAALADISKREDDIAIDAPRYMDTLGQVLGQCLVPMNNGRNKHLLKKFLTKSLQSYAQQSRDLLLASTMKGIAGRKDERFAKEIWDMANLEWSSYLNEGTNLEEFLESQEVKFTTQSFSPEPRKARRAPEETEKFADDVTDMVEKRCTSQALEDLVKDLNLEADEVVDYLGTLVYAIVRGCLVTDSEDYKLDAEALNKYSTILKNQQQQNKKDQGDAIALNALTALTKLWHQYNCPQNLMSNILLALHNHEAASYDALQTWLNSEDLKNIPGIGAARLNSKRCIEDLCAKRDCKPFITKHKARMWRPKVIRDALAEGSICVISQL